MLQTRTRERNGERGVTMLLVVVAMFAMLGMAILSIDVLVLYAAKTDAQRTADAAALAGARMFVRSGFTSWQLGDPSSGTIQDQLCTGGSPGTGMANSMALSTALQNPIEGQAPMTAISCNFTSPENPRITVTVGRTDLPTFFGRVLGWRTLRVSATSTAEAFNASGSSVPISVRSVKPWLIPNCDPGVAPPLGAPCGPYFVDSANGYVLKNPWAFIGKQFSFQMRNQVNPPASSQYYMIDVPAANICPATTAPGCLNVGGGIGSTGYLDTIACANTNRLQCGDAVNLDKLNGSPPNISDTISGTQCLIHTTTTGPGGTDQDSFSVGTGPVVITGGLSNPIPDFRGAANISSSDSIVTVPLFDWTTDPCPTQKCGTETVMGFLRLGIQDVTAAGNIDAVVVNAVGCNPGNTGTPVSGEVSALPVRLVR